jgi:transposase
MVVVDGQGVPLGSQLTSASPAEVRLAESTLATVSVPRGGPGRPQKRPQRVIADRPYDSDPLRWRLLRRGMLLISPYRKGRKVSALNDGRTLRRYRKRWKIERTFAWLGNYRRLVGRYDRRLDMYQAFFHVACVLITLRFPLK